jgi:hypothetical protein
MMRLPSGGHSALAARPKRRLALAFVQFALVFSAMAQPPRLQAPEAASVPPPSASPPAASPPTEEALDVRGWEELRRALEGLNGNGSGVVVRVLGGEVRVLGGEIQVPSNRTATMAISAPLVRIVGPAEFICDDGPAGGGAALPPLLQLAIQAGSRVELEGLSFVGCPLRTAISASQQQQVRCGRMGGLPAAVAEWQVPRTISCRVLDKDSRLHVDS